MPDVTIKYSGQSIDSLSDTGTKTLQTSGKYCTGNFTIEYTKPAAEETIEVETDSDAVEFIDYDGTIIQTYSAAEFAELSALPANPTHEGLIAQGWNWSLANAKALVAESGKLIIGQMYITDDGKTRIYIHLEKGRTSPMLGVCPNGTVDVDWGDGTTHDTLTGTSITAAKWTPTHEYAAPGDYVIKLTVTGEMGFYGQNSNGTYSGLLRYKSSASGINNSYRNAIKKIEIGNNITDITSHAFLKCSNLASISIPNNIINFNGSNAFGGCSNLTSIVIPYNVINIGVSIFNNCYNLIKISIPNTVENISSSAFDNCCNLKQIIIPNTITQLSYGLFYSCYNYIYLRILILNNIG